MTYQIERSDLYFDWVEKEALRSIATKLTERVRQELLAAISPTLPEDVTQRLVTALDDCVARRFERLTFEGNLATPGVTSKKLRRLAKTIQQLREAAADLDWRTRRELGPFFTGSETKSIDIYNEPRPPEMVELETALCSASDTLQRISLAIKDRFLTAPENRGGPQRKIRIDFVLEIAQTIDQLSNGQINIVSTAGHLFESIVLICLRRTEGEIKDVHRLILDAVRAYHKKHRAKSAITSSK